MADISSSTGQMQGESIKQTYSKHHKTFDGFSVMQTAKYDYTTKPLAVIQNYFKNHLHNRETKHSFKTRCNQ